MDDIGKLRYIWNGISILFDSANHFDFVMHIVDKGYFLKAINLNQIRIIEEGLNDPIFIPTFSYQKYRISNED